jgi:hypothetical protein
VPGSDIGEGEAEGGLMNVMFETARSSCLTSTSFGGPVL